MFNLLIPYTMQRLREFRTSGDFFYMEVNFLPETDKEEEDLYDGFVSHKGPHGEYVLRLSWMIRYPKNPGVLPRTRFAALAHPNLSPVIVAEETHYFLSLIQQMLSTK